MKKTVLFLFYFLLIIPVFSQQYNFHNYSVRDGVAQSQVYSLLQDSRGYLWMGTRGGGISRFDGMGFKTYTVNDGLVNNYVFCIKEDPSHNLWIGTNNGLSQYNGILFSNHQPDSDSSQAWIKDLDFDSKGRKWLATNSGVMFLDSKNKFTNVSDLLKIKREVINTIFVDKNGSIWYGGSGLFKITENNGTFSVLAFGREQGFRMNSITCITEDEKGHIWIGTYGDGAYEYDGKRFSRIDFHLELYKQTVNDIYFDNDDKIWFATLTSGVIQYNRISKSFSSLTENEGLSNNHVQSIIRDKSGNYWFGTSGGGVCNYFGKQFSNYDKSSGLSGNFIYSIFRDSKNRLWTGTSDKGLSVMDSSGITNYNAASGFANVKVKAINEDRNGIIYIGTDGDGVYTYNGTEFKPYEGLAKKYVRAIVKDRNGDLYIATAGTGLYKLSFGKAKAALRNFTTTDGLLHNRLTCLLYDKQGRLWYGTENNGIGYLVNDVPQKKSISKKNGLQSNTIRCLTEDGRGYLWTGTGGYGIAGFALYQGNSFDIKTYDHTNGLTSSNIYLITADKEDNLFVGTETGLDYIVLDKLRKPSEIKHYSKGEGFTGIETCQNAVFNDADGSIWFGTINGLSKYNPANSVKNNNEPVTNITDIKLFYESIANTPYKKFVQDWNSIPRLELPYDQNHLTFDFFAINFSNPDAVKYQWKLEGFDKDWSPVSKNHSILYSNLSAGDYVFMVKACNEDGIWNKEPVTMPFSIAAPVWLRWWFITLVLILFIAFVLIIFKWRVNRIRTKAEEQQRKLQLEKELVELEQKALRLQMNPHFIFNALNSIQSQIGTDNEQAARYYLAKFSRLMRQILDNSRSAAISLEEEVNTLENYLLIEKFCNGDRFDYTITVAPDVEKDYIKVPPMLLQPFVENAIKHGLKYVEGKRGLIEVHFAEKDGMLECSVMDNGIGRDRAGELNKNSKETYHTSTALIVTQERLHLLKDEQRAGSLEIIDLYDEQGNAAGTKVIVRIPLL